MFTDVTNKLGIEVPIFAFSHCRDVVAAVTKAGGMGVLGAAWMTPEELDMSIEWIEKEVDGKPFGVDLVFPGTAIDDEKTPEEYLASIPPEYLSFVKSMLDEGGLSDLTDEDRNAYMVENASKMAMTNKKSRDQLDVTLARDSVSLIVGALGVTPDWVVKEAHAQNVQVGALVGSGRHAEKQREAGVDLIVAQGTEAGGSVGYGGLDGLVAAGGRGSRRSARAGGRWNLSRVAHLGCPLARMPRCVAGFTVARHRRE